MLQFVQFVIVNHVLKISHLATIIPIPLCDIDTWLIVKLVVIGRLVVLILVYGNVHLTLFSIGLVVWVNIRLHNAWSCVRLAHPDIFPCQQDC